MRKSIFIAAMLGKQGKVVGKNRLDPRPWEGPKESRR